MIEVAGVRLPLDAGLPGGETIARGALANALGVKTAAISDFTLLRRSIDARKKNDIGFAATYAVALEDETAEQRILAGKGNVSKKVKVALHEPYEPLAIPALGLAARSTGRVRPVVVGTGPAGLFAALYLAQAGLRPIVLERGGDVEERQAAVAAFEAGENLDVRTNVQFGEGGAGTFSDGKLTTGTKSHLAKHVLRAFVDAGAPDEILWQAKPHIGTDKLVGVVRNLRRRIEQAGGQVRFHAQLTDVVFDAAGHLCEVEVRHFPVENDASSAADAERIPCDTLVLACGHSARDTFRMLQSAQLAMEPKPFSIGVRIEHLQADIDRAQYGAAAGHPALGSADYKLVAHLPNGRSVYTFCMCPGGQVVGAASEEFGVVVNGMSRFARDGENANAALLVNVAPADCPGSASDPLAGATLQRRIEQAAYGEAVELGGAPWQAPAQTVGDFLADEAGNPSPTVKPSYARGVVWCDLREILPNFITGALAEALPLLDRKLRGFADPGAVMTGVETRSSSPVRILRDPDTLQAWRRKPRKRVRARDIARGHGRAPEDEMRIPCGIYPCGEGAGYAGGIMSAAVDGLRVAQAIAASVLAEDDAVGSFAAAVDALKAGNAAIFPTDTVFGLGVSVRHAQSPQAIYDIKEREAGKPIAWLVSGPEALDEFGVDVSDEARDLVKAHWPGELTVIVRASDAVPEAFRSQTGTIGLRMPASPEALALIEALGGPLAASSANLSGANAPRTADELDPRLLERVQAVLISSETQSGLPSTVVDCSQATIAVLREGAVHV